MVRLPDPVALGRDPDSETGLAGMQTLLLLVLGCAVQGPSKESVIEDIKKLPLATQHDIVNCIQQVRTKKDGQCTSLRGLVLIKFAVIGG